MNILWLCNIIPPVIAKELELDASSKEGWISGLCDTVLRKQTENGISLSIAAPVPDKLLSCQNLFFKKELSCLGKSLIFYGFHEDLRHPEIYDSSLEESMKAILKDASPELVHCFGTEYPHTLAMCRSFAQREHLLIHIQGLCAPIANAYFANLPERIVRSVTFRDLIKKDSLKKQQKKFVLRGQHEKEAIALAGNIAGRTGFDRYYTKEWNPLARYFKMQETLRPEFYRDAWDADNCAPHSIFLSQGDYPLKGFHYMLTAMPAILDAFPDATLYVAGGNLTEFHTLKQKLKISAYGLYLRKLIQKNSLTDKVFFLGRLTAEEMKAQYLKSSLYVCCSSIENSPNSLGEAMILGMPCIAAKVGGIPDLFTERPDFSFAEKDISGRNTPADGKTAGIMYDGFECPENEYGYTGRFTPSLSEEEKMRIIAGNLSNSVIAMWNYDRNHDVFCRNARYLAMRNHNPEKNYADLVEIYTQILS